MSLKDLILDKDGQISEVNNRCAHPSNDTATWENKLGFTSSPLKLLHQTNSQNSMSNLS